MQPSLYQSQHPPRHEVYEEMHVHEGPSQGRGGPHATQNSLPLCSTPGTKNLEPDSESMLPGPAYQQSCSPARLNPGPLPSHPTYGRPECECTSLPCDPRKL